jgi:hypothetical protein
LSWLTRYVSSSARPTRGKSPHVIDHLFLFSFSLYFLYIFFFVVLCKDSRRNASVKMRLFIYLFISVFSFTKKGFFCVCVFLFLRCGLFCCAFVRAFVYFLFCFGRFFFFTEFKKNDAAVVFVLFSVFCFYGLNG